MPDIAIPEWRRRLQERPPMADHWRTRHHCTDAVLGSGTIVGILPKEVDPLVPQERTAPAGPPPVVSPFPAGRWSYQSGSPSSERSTTLQSEAPAVPKTAAELQTRWDERDAQYMNGEFMDNDAAAAVREARAREASMLPEPYERARMYGIARTWRQPVPWPKR